METLAMTRVSEPTQPRARRTCDRIRAAARKRFARHGFRGTRVDDIARDAGVNKERIYAYFGNKNDLFVLVLQDAFEEIARADEALLDLPDDELAHLQDRLMRHYVEFHAKHPHFRRLLAWENLEGGKHTEALHNIRKSSFLKLRELYEKGQHMGHLRRDVTFEAWLLVIISVSYFYFTNMRTMSKTLGLDLKEEAVRAQLVDEMLKLLSTD
jgi:AcrR family transcriptional regulator